MSAPLELQTLGRSPVPSLVFTGAVAGARAAELGSAAVATGPAKGWQGAGGVTPGSVLQRAHPGGGTMALSHHGFPGCLLPGLARGLPGGLEGRRAGTVVEFDGRLMSLSHRHQNTVPPDTYREAAGGWQGVLTSAGSEIEIQHHAVRRILLVDEGRGQVAVGLVVQIGVARGDGR